MTVIAIRATAFSALPDNTCFTLHTDTSLRAARKL